MNLKFQSRVLDPQGLLGLITLDRFDQLNALTLEMVQGLYDQLKIWETDTRVKGVAINGAGSKAFCAGGDVKQLREAVLTQGLKAADQFFKEEYRLDYLIARYPKPILVFGHGWVLGGGVGLLQGASHTVLNKGATLAMPEVLIGLIPDVGATYYLPRLKHGLGAVLALTGIRISAFEAKAVGWVKYVVPHDTLDDMLEALSRHSEAHIFDALDRVSLDAPATEHRDVSSVEPLKNWCHEYWAMPPRSPAELANRLHSLSRICRGEPSLTAVEANLAQASPYALWQTHLKLQSSKDLSLFESLVAEREACLACIEHGDFLEAVRVKLVDRSGEKPFKIEALEALDKRG